MSGSFEGFPPVYDDGSRLLILGSFPSVMSRAQGFYYGNPQNRFWKTVCGYFGEPVPAGIAEKKDFLKRRGIALWDVVVFCEIDGSKDASIRGERIADLPSLLAKSRIEKIFCNGGKSFSLLEREYPALMPVSRKLPSTSPANPRFSETVWHEALNSVFKGEKS